LDLEKQPAFLASRVLAAIGGGISGFLYLVDRLLSYTTFIASLAAVAAGVGAEGCRSGRR
jgi:hypothetical protein